MLGLFGFLFSRSLTSWRSEGFKNRMSWSSRTSGGAPVEEPIQSERDANYKANTQTYTDIHRPKHLQLAKPAKYVAVNSRLCYIVD